MFPQTTQYFNNSVLRLGNYRIFDILAPSQYQTDCSNRQNRNALEMLWYLNEITFNSNSKIIHGNLNAIRRYRFEITPWRGFVKLYRDVDSWSNVRKPYRWPVTDLWPEVAETTITFVSSINKVNVREPLFRRIV